MDIYIDLFTVFFKIGLFGFGGGYSMLSMIQYEVVEARGWLSIAEFTDIVAISQITPGPISINSATYIGYTVTNGNVWGSVVATGAVCLPSVILMTIVCRFFFAFKKNPYVSATLEWMQPAAIGLIVAAAFLLMDGTNFIDFKSVCIAMGAFILTYFCKIGMVRLILISGLIGYLLY